MKRLCISMLVVLLTISFCLVPAYAQLPNLSLYQTAADKTQFKLKLEAGKQYYVQRINELHISDPTPAKGKTAVMTIGTGAKLDVINIDANGNMQVSYTYKWIKQGIKTGDEEKVYDSSKKDSTVPEEFQWYKPLLEESFSLTISPEGRISDIKDLDKLRSNVGQKLPERTKEIAMNSLSQWLDEQMLRESIENSIAIFPDKSVGVGDSWSKNITYSSGTAMILENKWTLKERKNGMAVIEVASTIKTNPQAKPMEMGSGITSSSELTGTQQGLIEIQESTGLIIKSKITQQISGQNKITFPDKPDEVTPMEIKSVISTEASDWEKAKSTIGTNVVAQEQPRRERPSSPQEGFRRRENLSGASQTSPYLVDGEEGMMPPQPRSQRQQRQQTLTEAVAMGNTDQVQALLSQGVDVNQKNRMGWTPLHTAVQKQNKEIAEIILAKNPDLNITDKRGQTPLHMAVNSGQKEIVQLLIAKGANVNAITGSDNALTLARKRRYTEIADIITQNGGREPTQEELMGERYYMDYANAPTANQQQPSTPSRAYRGRTGRGRAQAQPVEIDILADPNEIKARINTFPGLQKIIDDVDANSQNEMRQWQQTRYDNRTMLIRSVQKQFEDEVAVIRNVSVSEKAEKTTAAIDVALTLRQERFKLIRRELLAQRREQMQSQQTTRSRGRGRMSSRGSSRYGSQGGQSDSYESGGYGSYGRSSAQSPYGGRDTMGRSGSRYARPTRPPTSQQQAAEMVDRAAQDESRQWMQASFEDKSDLATAVNDQIQLEVTALRVFAVAENAKKTTAAIDGILLARQDRLDDYLQKMEQLQLTQRQGQDPRMGMNSRYQQDSRYSPRGGSTSGGYQQGNQRTRRRR